MKNIVGIISVVIFIFTSFEWFQGTDLSVPFLPGIYSYLFLCVLPIIGMVLAFLTSSKSLSVVAFVCNLGIFFFVVIFPLFFRVIWNPIP